MKSNKMLCLHSHNHNTAAAHFHSITGSWWTRSLMTPGSGSQAERPSVWLNFSFPFAWIPLVPSPPRCHTPLRHCFEWSILPACVTFSRRRRGSGGGLWRRVLPRPIAGRRGRRTAHVYRQHSAGRAPARWEPHPDWTPQKPELESPARPRFIAFPAPREGSCHNGSSQVKSLGRVCFGSSTSGWFPRTQAAILSNRVQMSLRLPEVSGAPCFAAASSARREQWGKQTGRTEQER